MLAALGSCREAKGMTLHGADDVRELERLPK